MVFIILNGIAGLAMPFATVMEFSMLQESFKQQYLGRVSSVILAILSLAGPISLAVTILAEDFLLQIGVQNLLVIGGAGKALAGLALAAVPIMRNYDKELKKRICKNSSE